MTAIGSDVMRRKAVLNPVTRVAQMIERGLARPEQPAPSEACCERNVFDWPRLAGLILTARARSSRGMGHHRVRQRQHRASLLTMRVGGEPNPEKPPPSAAAGTDGSRASRSLCRRRQVQRNYAGRHQRPRLGGMDPRRELCRQPAQSRVIPQKADKLWTIRRRWPGRRHPSYSGDRALRRLIARNARAHRRHGTVVISLSKR
jgi:hypothetical protein